MTRKYRGSEVHRSGNDQKPAGKKMQTTRPAVFVEDIIRAARTYGRSWVIVERRAVIETVVMIIPADRQFEQRNRQIVARLAPIKTWVAHQDDESAKGECKKARAHDPMREPDP